MLVYVERQVADHPRTRRVLDRVPKATVVECERYGEIFNRRQQNFRLQKQTPVLILAHKHDGHVHRTPEGYGIGSEHNFYFAHLLNCPYDCRYCFLQGMYRSAAWVLFVNYEDFFDAIERRLGASPGKATFFSGYDCDSLALEHVSGFVEEVLPFFREHEDAGLELRTKSTNIGALIEAEPFDSCVVAFSMTPASFGERYEHGVPSFARRLQAMVRVQEAGWPIGLRFDPLFAVEGFAASFEQMLTEVFSRIDPLRVHSVSLGLFRLPRDFHRRMVQLYPDEPLLNMTLEPTAPAGSDGASGLMSFPSEKGSALFEQCRDAVLQHVDAEVLFPCS